MRWKNVIKTTILLICSLLMSGPLIFGQKEFRKGHIITVNHDTVNGSVDFGGDDRNSELCTFKTDSGTERVYYPFEIEGYRYTSGKFYISKFVKLPGSTKACFVEYLVKGKKNLYFIGVHGHPYYLIDYKNDTVIDVPYSDKPVFKDGQAYYQESTLHIGYLKSYFNDCPALYPDIDKIGQPDTRNMVSLTRKYHHLACNDTGCIVYYKKPKGGRVAIEPVFGYIKYQSNAPYFPQYKFLLHFWIPRSNERMYMVIGMTYGKAQTDSIDYTFYKVPIKFEYQLPYRIIKPKFDAGMYFMYFTDSWNRTGFGFNLTGSAGILICVSENIGFDINVEAELFPYFKSPSFFITHSFNAGLYIKF